MIERSEAVRQTAALCSGVEFPADVREALTLAPTQGQGRMGDVYRVLAAIADRLSVLAARAEDDDAQARRECKVWLAAEAALRIAYIATTPTEIAALAEDAAARMG